MQWLTTKKEVDRLFKARHERWINFFGRMTKFAKIRAEYRCEYCGRPEDTEEYNSQSKDEPNLSRSRKLNANSLNPFHSLLYLANPKASARNRSSYTGGRI
jgi:hypothetical protein